MQILKLLLLFLVEGVLLINPVQSSGCQLGYQSTSKEMLSLLIDNLSLKQNGVCHLLRIW
jgi:hypothetical protein